MTFSTREEAEQATRTLFSEWGAELVVKTIAQKVRETNERFNCSPCERQRVWDWLKGFLHE